MKHKLLTALILLFFGGIAYCSTGGLFPVHVKITVVDEKGNAIENADVAMTAIKSAKPWETTVGENTEGKTDKEGKFSALVRTMTRVNGDAQKEGYYGKRFTTIDYPTEATNQDVAIGLPITVERTIVLRKILNPAPLKVIERQILYLKENDKKIGYDLDKGDLLAPYGMGEKADFYLEQKGYFKDHRDYDLQLFLNFPNKGDGIFAFDPETDEWRFAPEQGYQPEFQWRLKRLAEKDKPLVKINELQENRKNYFLRVRTVLDKDGNILKANYVRIETSEYWAYGGTGYPWQTLKLNYRFNPEVNNRSLEIGEGTVWVRDNK